MSSPSITASQKVLDLIESNVGYTFKWFREGDPIFPPLSMIPAVFATETDTTFSSGPTGHDEVERTILIQVVFNKKDEFGNPDESGSLDKLINEVVQGKNTETGKLKSDTIMGILRENITIDNLAVSNVARLRTGVVPRQEELVTVEAHIVVEFTEIVELEKRV